MKPVVVAAEPPEKVEPKTNLLLRWMQLDDQYLLVSRVFLKLLALIYFAAFFSLTVQIAGLVGPEGILPFQEFLDRVFEKTGRHGWWKLPTLFWINSSNIALQGVAWAGCVLSIFLLISRPKRWVLILLFVAYLSLFHAGQTFLTFQWDSLLLETGFLSIFLVNGPSKLLIFLYHWLLFRFRFMSGISKLASGDPSWSGLTSLNYYFETQPLPHFVAWYVHQFPEWLLKAGVIFTFFTELIVPFFIFLPRKWRITAAVITIFMQSMIIATSNHNFVNLLTILLCLFLLDDRIIRRFIPKRFQETKTGRADWPQTLILPVFGALIVMSSVVTFYPYMGGKNTPEYLRETSQLTRNYGLGHIFHIFPTMQIDRHELEVEGSNDGEEWKAYTFKYKPGPLDVKPAFIVPHQPRLDWMIWFVPSQSPENMYWFDRFLRRLWEGEQDVINLLAENPFQDKPPKYLRALVYKYNFTSKEEKDETGRWWKREYLGVFPYLPPRYP